MDEFVLLAGRIVTGLLAGVYAAFLVAVMPALHGQCDRRAREHDVYAPSGV